MVARLAVPSPISVTVLETNGSVIDNSSLIFTPSNNSTVSIQSGALTQIINPSNTLGNLTILMPGAPINNPIGSTQDLNIIFMRNVNNLSWIASSGASNAGAARPSSVSAGAKVSFVWIQPLSQWIHVIPA